MIGARLPGCRRTSLIGLLAAVLLCLPVPPVAAAPKQAPAPAAAAAASEHKPVAPPVYDLSEIVPRSEQSLVRAREIRAKLDADRTIELFEADLPDMSRQFEAWWEGEARRLRDGLSVPQINDLAWELVARAARL
ncbi:MAG: hypothetical protein RIS35_2255, partial [Pseudomonadota bacterium]